MARASLIRSVTLKNKMVKGTKVVIEFPFLKCILFLVTSGTVHF
jgi:hypothetical protein